MCTAIGYSLLLGSHSIKLVTLISGSYPCNKIGIQQTCKEFANYIEVNPLVKQIMSRKGNCWNNALTGSFFKKIKTELIYHDQYKTRMEVELQIFKYIDTWYNRVRRYLTLNRKSASEFNQINNMKSAA